MKERKHYIDQYNEVAEIAKGMTMDQVRKHFGNAITNDLEEDGLIDVNYKDICVTFKEKKGRAELVDSIEIWSEDGYSYDLIRVQ